MAEENQEQQEQPIPEERVFATLRLYLEESGDIAADIEYNGTKLLALGVKPLKGMICRHAFERARRDLQETIEHVGQMTEVADLLGNIFGLGETDDSKDANTTEGSDDSRAASASK